MCQGSAGYILYLFVFIHLITLPCNVLQRNEAPVLLQHIQREIELLTYRRPQCSADRNVMSARAASPVTVDVQQVKACAAD